MRRIATAIVATVALALAGCGGYSGGEAKEIFLYGFSGVYLASMETALGEEVPGVTVNSDGGLTFDSFDPEAYDASFPRSERYTAISGTSRPARTEIRAELTLEGEDDVSLSFGLTAEQMQSDAEFGFGATIDGEFYEFTISPGDLP